MEAAGGLRAGLTVAEAADVIWATNSAELFLLLTAERDWSPDRYETLAVRRVDPPPAGGSIPVGTVEAAEARGLNLRPVRSDEARRRLMADGGGPIGESLRELLGTERVERGDVDLVPRKRCVDRPEQAHLTLGETALGLHGRGDAASREQELVGRDDRTNDVISLQSGPFSAGSRNPMPCAYATPRRAGGPHSALGPELVTTAHLPEAAMGRCLSG